MMKPSFIIRTVIFLSLACCCALSAQNPMQGDPLIFSFDKKYGQVEVGGRFAGAEFHESRPLPSRISFYYPVANSIDLSTDYWKRGDSRPFAFGIRLANGRKHWIGREPWKYTLSPHRVTFTRSEENLEYRISYDFCFNEPALVQRITVRNISDRTIPVELYLHLNAILRTCQTYARKDSAIVAYDRSAGVFTAGFPDPDAGSASVFVLDAGVHPDGLYTDLHQLAVTDSGSSSWIGDSPDLILSQGDVQPHQSQPVTASIYNQSISPGDSLAIVRIIGTCRKVELPERISRLTSSWKNEIDANSGFVETYARKTTYIRTGDPWLDRSAVWARGVIAANQHYLDGTIIPMPCPAEYNFYFTHDLLLTDLGAINSDPLRVKRDLLYVIQHSRDGIIPHAYYWRDNGYQTEYCDSTNWNHLWFVITAARYLRHTGDDSTARALYPCMTASMRSILTQRKSDNLMYAYRPDWWDIGRREGPRSYITILTIRALRDYCYVSSRLQLNSERLAGYETDADSMQMALTSRLWDDTLQYLINYNENRKDRHYYMGSLLAPVYHVLDKSRSAKLLTTASQYLLRPEVGIMVAFPADFNTDSMRTFYRFAGNEAGDQYVYINGGIWPHANASYALALLEVGKPDKAMKFVKDVMTIDGIAVSPNGLPAMYEYRFANPESPEFGRIDKPSFLWAAGFYLNVLYAMSGLQENEWNISIRSDRPRALNSVNCSYTFGELHEVEIRGSSGRMKGFDADGRQIASTVLPLSVAGGKNLKFTFGKMQVPYLDRLNAILYDVRYEKSDRILTFEVGSFRGHRTTAEIISRRSLKSATLDGKPVADIQHRKESDGSMRSQIRFTGSSAHQQLTVQF